LSARRFSILADFTELQRAVDGLRGRLELRADDTKSLNAGISGAGLHCAAACEAFVLMIDEREADVTMCDLGAGRSASGNVVGVRDKEIWDEEACDGRCTASAIRSICKKC
jgi:hypothetical protein